MRQELQPFTRDGKFLMLAFDHRGSFKKLLKPGEDAVSAKREVISSMAGQFSGLLIDVETGLPAFRPPSAPYLLPLEKSGYVEDGGDRLTEIERSANELKRLGASGAKVLFYISPAADSLARQLETARKVISDCQSESLPLFLEIRVYPEADSSAELVERSLKAFLDQKLIPGVWKLEYPGNAEACRKLTEMAGETPWILLTAGVGFERFCEQLKDAISGGAQGFLAGRAVWQDVFKLHGNEREEFLSKTLPERFRQISGIVLKA